MKFLKYILLLIICATGLTACIEDGFETSPSAQPEFSADTLRLGTQFVDEPTPTYMLKIYNRHSRQLCLQSVRMRLGADFRINVDGMSGTSFSNVEIRPNDSIYVFVEATLPSSGQADVHLRDVMDHLDVVTNGVTSSVVVTAQATEVVRLHKVTLTADATFTADRPYLVTDTLTVAPDATLTLSPGTRLLFHDKAAMLVQGSLQSLGTAEQPVTMRGDRTGNVVADISYEVMSNQWDGIRLTPSAHGNMLSHTDIANTCNGLALDSLTSLTMINSRLTNSGNVLLAAGPGCELTILGSELSNATAALALLHGGTYRFDRCTLANYYLFSYPTMEIVTLEAPEETTADFTNCIIYGRGAPLSDGDLSDYPAITFRRCLFAVGGEDDANFLECLWEQDPMLDFSLTDYVFPYTPLPDSPALDAAYPALNHPDLPDLDLRARPRAATLGAYAPAPTD